MRKKIRNKRGQSVLEFLLVSPVLIYSLFLLMIICDICNNIIVANHAAYYFCRTVVVQKSAGIVSATVKDNALATAQLVMPPDWGNGTPEVPTDFRYHGIDEAYNPDDESTWDVSVDIVYRYPLPKILEFFGADYEIHGYCLMRKIQY